MAQFRGGVHPADGKAYACEVPIVTVAPGEELVFPMSQHIGAPASVCVEVGQEVLMGQKLGEASGFVSANIISSVSGTVTKIEPRKTVNGSKCLSVIVKNDGLDRPAEGFGTPRDPSSMSREEMIAAVQEAGIVGMGGACFPTHVKLSVKDPDQIDHVLVNGSECEPYLTSDDRIMREKTPQLIGGLRILLSLFPKARGVICIEDNKPAAIQAVREAIKDEERMRVLVAKTKYPQGAERMLIYTATGRKINSTMLPADAGCVVDNVDTVTAIYYAVCESVPLMRRIITVTGDAIANPGNFETRLGTDMSRLIEAAGGYRSEPKKLISGGPMMGLAVPSADFPVTKNATALTALTADDVADATVTACIRCGMCVTHCPERLMPEKLARMAQQRDYEGFERAGGMECFGCGSCTFGCPAKRPLAQLITAARGKCLQLKKEQQQRRKQA